MAFKRRASLDEIRAFYAQMMAVTSDCADERLEQAFELVPREVFLGPGPWRIMVNHRYVETPSADPAYLYQNVLVALDAAKGINNGEPFLHAAWIGAIAPRSGETIVHIGAGTGYYAALLSVLVLPNGQIHAFEIDAGLAKRARQNLEPFEGVTVVDDDATKARLPTSDVIYVSAGVIVPPASWIAALKPGGRLIFPWRPTASIGVAVLVTRTEAGFTARPLMCGHGSSRVSARPIGTSAGRHRARWRHGRSARSGWPTSVRPTKQPSRFMKTFGYRRRT